MNLVQRSYEKETGKIHWTPPGNKKEIFGYPNENSLSKMGRNIIGKFVHENHRLESKRKNEEDYALNYKHSKHPVQINPWKFNSKNDLFSDYKADKFHWFKKEIENEPTFKQQPFRIPKKDPEDFSEKKKKSPKLIKFEKMNEAIY